LANTDEELFSAKQHRESADAEALRDGQALGATIADLKRDITAARARIESLQASRILKAVTLVSGSVSSTAKKASAELSSTEQCLAKIELISKAMVQRASEGAAAGVPGGAPKQHPPFEVARRESARASRS
jgi:hypothetical protein